MTLPIRIASFLATIAATFVVALVATLVAWNIQIEHRAFQCTDDIGFGAFWEDMDVHQRAGDRVLAGWSWDQLKQAETTYKQALFLIWSVSTLAAGAIIFSKAPHAQNA